MTALHGRWLARSADPGAVVSGYGAGLVMLGVFVGSGPYLRAGIAKTADKATGPSPVAFAGAPGAARRHRERVEAERSEIIKDTWAERVIAVAVVLLGTFLNGYGAAFAYRWTHHG